jgi:hypothetical protein
MNADKTKNAYPRSSAANCALFATRDYTALPLDSGACRTSGHLRPVGSTFPGAGNTAFWVERLALIEPNVFA